MGVGPCLVLVAGGAGTGKSGVARGLVRRVPHSLLLDKDRILGEWVDRLLAARGEDQDRDGRFYWEVVRPREYATLEAVAYDHLELGKIVVVDAPLRPELDDPAWMARVRDECAARGAAFLAVWVLAPTETARRRMAARAEPRDRWKLAHWEEFLRRQPYAPPTGAMLILENDDGADPEALVVLLLDRIASGGADPDGTPPPGRPGPAPRESR